MYAEILELVISSLESEWSGIDGYTISNGVITNNYTRKEELNIRHSSIQDVLNFLTSVKRQSKFEYVKDCLGSLAELVKSENLNIEFKKHLHEGEIEDAYIGLQHHKEQCDGMALLRQMLVGSC